jgi:hypothetical protein
MAWPTVFRFRTVTWQRVTPHCCAHSPAEQAIQVGIVQPSAVLSRPGPLWLSFVPPPQNFPSIAELHRWQRAQINSGKLTEHTHFYDKGIQKLVLCYDKRLNSGGDYAGK